MYLFNKKKTERQRVDKKFFKYCQSSYFFFLINVKCSATIILMSNAIWPLNPHAWSLSLSIFKHTHILFTKEKQFLINISFAYAETALHNIYHFYNILAELFREPIREIFYQFNKKWYTILTRQTKSDSSHWKICKSQNKLTQETRIIDFWQTLIIIN